jgi:hypothetical protein
LAGTVGVGLAAGAVGVAGVVAAGYVVEHSEEVNQRPDPDEISLPGGAPPQTDVSPDAGAPAQDPNADTDQIEAAKNEPPQLSDDEKQAIDDKNAGRPFDDAAYQSAMKKLRQGEKFSGDRNKQKRKSN